MTTENQTKLTPKRESFCHEYLKDSNATQAAIRAGYSSKSARTEGSRLLALDDISERIEQLRAELAARTSVSPEKIVRELASIAFADIGDVLRMAHDGSSLRFDFETMPPEFTKSVSSIKVETFTEGRGERGREVRSVDLKMIDKRGALVDLAKIFGMMREQVDHNITARHDGDDLADVNDETLMDFIASKGVIVVEPTSITPGNSEQQGEDVAAGEDSANVTD